MTCVSCSPASRAPFHFLLARIDPTALVYGTFAALFGLAVGSFVNVVAHRLPSGGVRSLSGRSRCPRCSASIAWYDNIPLFAFLALRGRCRACSARISPRYPVVEAIAAALFVAAWWATPGSPEHGAHAYSWLLVVRWVVLAALLALSIIDLDLRILPDEITISGMVIGPIAAAIAPELLTSTKSAAMLADAIPNDRVRAVLVSLGGLVVGAGSVALIRSIGTRAASRRRDYALAPGEGDVRVDAFLARQTPRRSKREVRALIEEGHVTRLRGGAAPAVPVESAAEPVRSGDVVRVTFLREAMGFGDVKLQGAIGAFVGPEGSLLVLALASVAGAAVGVLNLARLAVTLRLRAARRGRKGAPVWPVARAAGAAIPFGPFLAVGAASVLLYRRTITDVLGDLFARSR